MIEVTAHYVTKAGSVIWSDFSYSLIEIQFDKLTNYRYIFSKLLLTNHIETCRIVDAPATAGYKLWPML